MNRIILGGLLVFLSVHYQTHAAEPTYETWDASLYSYGGQVKAEGSGDIVTLSDGTRIDITVGVGTPNYAALYATDNGEIYLTDGFLSTDNVQSVGAATVDTGGYIRLDNVRIETYDSPSGRWRTGLMALSGGTIDYGNGEIVTTGIAGHGVHASNAGSVNVTNSNIKVSGGSAAGAYVGIGATVNITDSDILATSSDEGYGLYAIYSGATINMTNGTLTTEGSTANPSLPLPAVYGRLGANITLNNVTLRTRGGSNASGLLSRETNTRVTMNGGTINTVGSDSYGAYAIQGGTVVLNDSSIRTTGANSHGVWVWDGSYGELNGGYVWVDGTKNSYAVLTSDTGQVTGQGVYDVTGDMRNSNNGSIDLDFRPNSLYKGGTDVGGGRIDFLMTDSVWTMDKSSTLTNLDLTRGSINYRTENSRYGTLTTVNLTGGDGIFSIRTDVGGDGGGVNNTGDLLSVTGDSDGSHHLIVDDNGSHKTIGVERLTVVKTVDGIADFDLLNTPVEIGAYLFGLRRVPEDITDWELYTEGEKSNSGKETPGLLMETAYRIVHIENQTLLQRMGELRQNPCFPGGIWARYLGGQVRTSSSQGVAGASMHYNGMQLGLDKAIHAIPNSEVYLGIVGGLSHNKTDFRVGDGKTKSYHAGVYGVLKHENGFYIDALARYFHMDHDLTTLTSATLPVKGDGRLRGASASIEVGKRFYTSQTSREKWFVEPQAQMTYSRFNSASITMSHGLKTTLHGYDSLLGRAGFLVGYSSGAFGAGPMDIYAKANYLREFKGNASYIYNDFAPSRQQYRFGRQWLEVGAGVNMRIKERHNIYADYVFSKGGRFHQNQVNVGYRFSF